MNQRDLNQIVEALKVTPPPEMVTSASERVRQRLDSARGFAPSAMCANFHPDLIARQAGTLPDARRMLLDDHLSSCVACRHLVAGDAEPRIVLRMPSRRPPIFRRAIMLAAAAAVTIGLGFALPPVLDRALSPGGPRATVAAIEGTLLTVSENGTRVLTIGAGIDENQEIRTGRDSHAVIQLRDGSAIEMSERSELHLTERWLGRTIHLTRGDIVVEAANQGRGKLEVATADFLISVKGTIFGVSQGLKGSRVSVVDGEVQVDHAGAVTVLHSGEQSASSADLAPTTVESELAWSRNFSRYSALLAKLPPKPELASGPSTGVHPSPSLLDRVPADAVMVFASPNLSQALTDATQSFEDRAKSSPEFAAWLTLARTQEMHQAMDRMRQISGFLSDEVLMAGSGKGWPISISQLRDPASEPALRERMAQLGFTRPYAIEGGIIVLGSDTAPPAGEFVKTTFGTQVADAYRRRTGQLFAANLEQMSANAVFTNVPNVHTPLNSAAPPAMQGLRYMIAERAAAAPGAPSGTDSASMTLHGDFRGLSKWLAAPGPIGSLEFISAQASFAAAFATRNPRDLLSQLFTAGGATAAQFLDAFQARTGIDPLEDFASSLGGEATIAVDGAILPFPDWKLVLEVENPARLQESFEKMVDRMTPAVPEDAPADSSAPKLTSETVGNRKFYTLALATPAINIHYTFIDGYFLAGANRQLLLTAISNRAAGLTLARASSFRSQLPADSHGNVSGVLYYNFGPVVGPFVDQLAATGLLPADQQSSIQALTQNRDPGVVYLYSEADRITVGSRGNLLNLGMRTLGSLASGDISSAIPLFGSGFPKSSATGAPSEPPTQ